MSDYDPASSSQSKQLQKPKIQQSQHLGTTSYYTKTYQHLETTRPIVLMDDCDLTELQNAMLLVERDKLQTGVNIHWGQHLWFAPDGGLNDLKVKKRGTECRICIFENVH